MFVCVYVYLASAVKQEVKVEPHPQDLPSCSNTDLVTIAITVSPAAAQVKVCSSCSLLCSAPLLLCTFSPLLLSSPLLLLSASPPLFCSSSLLLLLSSPLLLLFSPLLLSSSPLLCSSFSLPLLLTSVSVPDHWGDDGCGGPAAEGSCPSGLPAQWDRWLGPGFPEPPGTKHTLNTIIGIHFLFDE